MNTGPTFYCWHCYAKAPQSTGECPTCGNDIHPPDDVGYADRLLWALRHPLPDRQLIAVRVLGLRREQRAIHPLRALLATETDPYLAAAALTALVEISGLDQCRGLVDTALHCGRSPLRHAAQRLLATRRST